MPLGVMNDGVVWLSTCEGSCQYLCEKLKVAKSEAPASLRSTRLDCLALGTGTARRSGSQDAGVT